MGKDEKWPRNEGETGQDDGEAMHLMGTYLEATWDGR